MFARASNNQALNCAWGCPKLTDFGLARRVEGGAGLTQSGVPVGTPNYMAPEQAEGKQVGPCADVYGLGAILYQLLTGRPPFQGGGALEILWQVVNVKPVSPRQLQSAVPQALDALCLRCMVKDPAGRPSVPDLIEEIEDFLAGVSGSPPGRKENSRESANAAIALTPERPSKPEARARDGPPCPRYHRPC